MLDGLTTRFNAILNCIKAYVETSQDRRLSYAGVFYTLGRRCPQTEYIDCWSVRRRSWQTRRRNRLHLSDKSGRRDAGDSVDGSGVISVFTRHCENEPKASDGSRIVRGTPLAQTDVTD